MKVKVFEIVKTGLAPLSEEIETTVQTWLNDNKDIEILTTSQSQIKKTQFLLQLFLRENTVFITIIYTLKSNILVFDNFFNFSFNFMLGGCGS